MCCCFTAAIVLFWFSLVVTLVAAMFTPFSPHMILSEFLYFLADAVELVNAKVVQQWPMERLYKVLYFKLHISITVALDSTQ